MRNHAIRLCAAATLVLFCAEGNARVFKIRTDAKTVARLERAVQYVMSISEQQMLAIVPRQSGIYFTDCPNCDKGTQDRGRFTWSAERPTQIRCTGCGAVYPNNPKHPDDKAIEVAGPDGPHRYPYHERPKDKYRIFLRAHADYMARQHMARQCQYLAELFAATGKEAYARRAALILLRFAEVYPGYAYHFDYPFRPKRFSPWTRNRVKGVGAFRTAKWSWWAYMDISLELVRAYDVLRDWPGWATVARRHPNGNPTSAAQVKVAIEKNLLGAMVEFAMGFREPYSNMSPVLWTSAIYAGRVLRRPEVVREAVRRFDRFTRERFLHDGHWMETSPSYGSQVYGLLRSVMASLAGCEDAEALGALSVDEVKARTRDAADSLLAPRLPNGRLLPVNDTWWTNQRTARQSTEPVLMPGLGVAVLGGGAGEHQLHAHLNFTGGRGHKHPDALSFGLFANGHELLPDIGYSHTRYRPWGISTMAHNTVAIDGLRSGRDDPHTGNRLRAFAVDGKGFSVAEAESSTAYAGKATRYRRTVVVVGADSRDAYVVDVFQAAGGRQHDWLLHGSADADSTAKVEGVSLERFAGTLMNPGAVFTPPLGESSSIAPGADYGFVHDLSSAKPAGPVALTMRLAKTPEVGTRTLLLCEPGTTVYLGAAPSVRRARSSDAELDKYQAPFFCARRAGAKLVSTFVAVHEPLAGKPAIRGARVDRTSDALHITVDRGARGVDHVFVALDKPAKVKADGIEFCGRYGLLRTRAGKPTDAHLVGGERLAFAGLDLTATPAWTGPVARAVRQRDKDSRGFFDVPEAIPPAPAAAALALVVTHADGTQHAYSVLRVERTAAGTRLHVREDPAFVYDQAGKGKGETRILCYPQRTIKGAGHTYELLNAAHAAR